MNRLPAFPLQYDVSWGNTFIRTLETNLTQLSQPISTGWNVSIASHKRTLNPTSAIGYVGRVSVSTTGGTNIVVLPSGVGGQYNGSLQDTDLVLETLIHDMKTRGLLA